MEGQVLADLLLDGRHGKVEDAIAVGEISKGDLKLSYELAVKATAEKRGWHIPPRQVERWKAILRGIERAVAQSQSLQKIHDQQTFWRELNQAIVSLTSESTEVYEAIGVIYWRRCHP